ncbi:WGxxGxxG family protein [Spirosoma soli]|uniref:WGxxGxxG family protein n=1 Tax=Spirosoma soli TaxID=1770529 RepID=A0ABW5LWQ0_9BACT
MKTMRKKAQVITMSALLIAMTPALSQAQARSRGYDVDQVPKETAQRDIEDKETDLDWVGLFGLLGLVGVVGRKRRPDQRETTMRKVAVIATVLLTSTALAVGTPALSQSGQGDHGNSSESVAQNEDNKTGSWGWIGLFGLAGLLGLGIPNRKKGGSNVAPR